MGFTLLVGVHFTHLLVGGDLVWYNYGILIIGIQTSTGWWFGTCYLLFFHILGISSSQVTFIFFRGVAQPPTRRWVRWVADQPQFMMPSDALQRLSKLKDPKALRGWKRGRFVSWAQQSGRFRYIFTLIEHIIAIENHHFLWENLL